MLHVSQFTSPIACMESTFHGLTVLAYIDVRAKPEMKDLVKELYSKASDMWEDIGILLGIKDGQLKQIRTDNANDSRSCLREMLRIWLSRVDPPPSWSAIAEAVEFLGDENLATHLRSKYN